MSIESMNVRDLRDLFHRINLTIERKQENAKVELRNTFKRMASESGLSIEEFVPGSAPTSKSTRKHSLTAMRDKKTGVIWAGAGKYPRNFEKSRAVPA